MRLFACVAVVCVVTGCATSGSGTSPNAELTANGHLTGVVKLPEQLSSAQPCDRISVVAMVNDTQVGRTSVRQSRSRCSYEITNVPTDVEVGLQVKTDGVQCANGNQVSAAAETVKLRNGEAAVKDLSASCG